ncbi:MAG: phytanoyl-CoA dioxygenase family protein [Candidatus Dependentiae bacterium]|nr:phytanoyl-CoA dioxygenase family protein [Candidatus Dependentiae bacterium]
MKLKTIPSTILMFFLVSVSALEAGETQGFLTNQEINLFHLQGYIVKRQCFTKEEVDQLRHHVEATIERTIKEIQQSNDQSLSEREQTVHIDGSRIIFKRKSPESLSIARINGVGGMQPAVLDTMRSEKMIRTYFELLNTTDLEHIICQLHPKMPGDGIAFPRHRDIQFRKTFDPHWTDILGNGSYAICIIALDHMTQENGGLWIDKNNYPEDQGLEEDIVWIDAHPGDLLFMHPRVFHGSGPNMSPTASRKTLLTGFCAFGANHKQYPGADVNVRLTLMKDSTIAKQPIVWEESSTALAGH